VGNPEKEPLCTVKELLVFGVICIVYSLILFSLDPEWVGWAAPLVFGGALYSADPPPASAHLGSPHDVFPMAYMYGFLSLFGIELLNMVKDRRHLTWLFWLKAESESGSVAKVRSFLRSHSCLRARALNSQPASASILQQGATTSHCEERVAALSHRSGPISRDHTAGCPKDLQPLHREVVSPGGKGISRR
jgi:hypothetical protein